MRWPVRYCYHLCECHEAVSVTHKCHNVVDGLLDSSVVMDGLWARNWCAFPSNANVLNKESMCECYSKVALKELAFSKHACPTRRRKAWNKNLKSRAFVSKWFYIQFLIWVLWVAISGTGCKQRQVSQLARVARTASLMSGMKVACSLHPTNKIKGAAG